MPKCQKCHKEKKCFTLRSCDHNFCYECLCKYINSNIKCKIKCPLKECQCNIPDQIMRKCLSNFETEIYEKMGILSSTPNAKKCLTKNCPNFFIIENEESIFMCDYCKQPNCFKCQKRHTPYQCGRNDIDENLIDITTDEIIKCNNRDLLKSQFLSKDFIPNPESFDCVCLEFVLPREGLIMRNCHHQICKDCFNDHMKTIQHVSQFTCAYCEKNVHDKEILNSIGISNLTSIIENQAAVKFFCCKFEDCTGVWDSNNLKGCHKCHLCGHINCMACEDIHENMSCEKYRASERYKELRELQKKIKQGKHVKCNCGKVLIQKDGCGSLHCNNCGIHVCLFTGKKAGNKGENSCGCTAEIPCHVDCLYGCYNE